MLENVAIWFHVLRASFYAGLGVAFCAGLVWLTLRLGQRPHKPRTKVLVATPSEWVGDIDGHRVTAFLYASDIWSWRTRDASGSAATCAGAIEAARSSLSEKG